MVLARAMCLWRRYTCAMARYRTTSLVWACPIASPLPRFTRRCKDTFCRNLFSRRITAPIPFSLKLSSSLQNQHDFTSMNSSKSASALDNHDVPQSSVLGPLLLLTEVFYPRSNPFLLCITVYVTRHLAFSCDLHVNKRPFIDIHSHQLSCVC